MQKSPEEMHLVRFGPFEVNVSTGELRKHDTRLRVQDQPFQVLVMLLARAGKLVTREEIRAKLWPSGTFVDFDNGLNTAISRLRETLGDSAERPHYIETLARRGYRWMAPVEWVTSGPDDSPPRGLNPKMPPATEVIIPKALDMKRDTSSGKERSLRWTIAMMAVVIAALVAGGLYWRSRRAVKLTDKDTIVLADFMNSTGDPVFDGTLRQGLSVQLEQSPFLNIVSDQQVQQTLAMMDQPADTKLTPSIAGQLCQRISGAAVLVGSIAQIGTQYLLTLKATNCSNGESLGSTEAQASDKNHVLEALSKTASEIRTKLGESLTTVQKFDTPLEQATTPSLEAFQAYCTGRNAMAEAKWAAAVPFFQRAIQLDPKFAMAYARLGASYVNMGESRLGAESTRKAYEMREGVSEGEKFYIESHYYQVVIGDQEKARKVYQLWADTYPRDWRPLPPLFDIYSALGQYKEADVQARAVFRLHPNSV